MASTASPTESNSPLPSTTQPTLIVSFEATPSTATESNASLGIAAVAALSVCATAMVMTLLFLIILRVKKRRRYIKNLNALADETSQQQQQQQQRENSATTTAACSTCTACMDLHHSNTAHAIRLCDHSQQWMIASTNTLQGGGHMNPARMESARHDMTHHHHQQNYYTISLAQISPPVGLIEPAAERVGEWQLGKRSPSLDPINRRVHSLSRVGRAVSSPLRNAVVTVGDESDDEDSNDGSESDSNSS
ncbi:hypothetical protein BJ741DRAFT_54585 [Chytriomyces cf. hyalinus JEL632]|nr:hypothetical protein BJ741DRAFT_54585 [Chytriomyces cf. hyalinus JEL632]